MATITHFPGVDLNYNLPSNVSQSNRAGGTQVKQLRNVRLGACSALLLITSLLVCPILSATPQHGFGVREYDHFHEVLHPLEHEALPKKDYRRIRAKAGQLVARGRAIVKIGVPAGTSEAQKEEFADGLKKFERALNKFRVDARRSNNAKLKTSYSAVHDSFETLAGMLPRS